jgi:hypothetical protein
MHIAFVDNGKYVKIRNLFSAKVEKRDMRQRDLMESLHQAKKGKESQNLS